ncbi:hypothetical protein NESM_000523000 [Novymonas esmeraldas]|uniref:B box-type domain-containing protein n=1 Tax=Novymonas esmeraldas TaxID=1808958 RepID=A0AAW0ET73_9TRYP
MSNARRFSAAPVNFDRFVVLARSHSRSLSPDNELQQMLRPFQARTTASTGVATRESAASRVTAVPPPVRSCVVIDKEGAPTQVRDGGACWTTPCTLAPSRSMAAVEDEWEEEDGVWVLPSTHAATSTSRSVSSGAAITSSSALSLPTPQRGCPVGDETQELAPHTIGEDEVDLLLHAACQLGSPLYDPTTGHHLCWRLHPLDRRPRTAYGDTEGVSCDFCGHTDWLVDDTDRGRDGKDEEKRDVAAAVSLAPQTRFFYHCATCRVDICEACVAEVRAEPRFHVPCLRCQRCGAYESRRDAPMHRCAEVTVPSNDDGSGQGGEQSGAIVPSSSCSETDGRPSPPETPQPLVLPPVRRTISSPGPRGVPVGGRVRLGLSRRQPQQPVKPEPVPQSEVAGGARRGAAAVAASPRKRGRASPEMPPSVSSHVKAEEEATVWSGGEGPTQSPPRKPPQQQQQQQQQQRGSAVAMPKPAPRAKQEVEDLGGGGGDPRRALLESTAPPSARYAVHLTPHTPEEVEEVSRIAREHRLLCSPAPAPARVSVFYFATRLAAETCVDRATVASLDALLKRHVGPMEAAVVRR